MSLLTAQEGGPSLILLLQAPESSATSLKALTPLVLGTCWEMEAPKGLRSGTMKPRAGSRGIRDFLKENRVRDLGLPGPSQDIPEANPQKGSQSMTVH